MEGVEREVVDVITLLSLFAFHLYLPAVLLCLSVTSRILAFTFSSVEYFVTSSVEAMVFDF